MARRLVPVPGSAHPGPGSQPRQSRLGSSAQVWIPGHRFAVPRIGVRRNLNADPARTALALFRGAWHKRATESCLRVMTVRPDQNLPPADAPAKPTRREALLAGGGALAAALLPSCAALAQQPPAAAAKADGLPTVLLEAKPAFVEFNPGKVTDLWAFGGRTPGPSCACARARSSASRLVNGIAKPTSLHWHGVRIANEADGVAGLTQDPVAPGAGLDLRFTPPDAGTFIYRPMRAGLDQRAVRARPRRRRRGGGGRSPAPVDLDQVLASTTGGWPRTARWSRSGPSSDRAGAGRLGNLLTVNGARGPFKITAAPGARVRLRLANLCSARIMRIRFDGMKAYVVSVDGQPTDTLRAAALDPALRARLALRGHRRPAARRRA